uniref:Uncharacterized protein n=1 Tax=Strigamia maritima TaxID=126957 RepID=T1JDT5_STRMM
MIKFVIPLLVVIALATAQDDATTTSTTTISPDNLAEETRFLFPGSNSTNVQVSAISVIGATLIGIAIALAIGGLLPAFSGAVGAASTFGKRSLPDYDPFDTQSPFSLFQILSLIDGFRGFNVADVDCQKKVVCELHRSGASVSGRDLGVLTDKVLDVFNYVMPHDGVHDAANQPLLRQYLDAAKKGKEKEDCERVYSTCEYSVRKVIRSLNN